MALARGQWAVARHILNSHAGLLEVNPERAADLVSYGHLWQKAFTELTADGSAEAVKFLSNLNKTARRAN